MPNKTGDPKKGDIFVDAKGGEAGESGSELIEAERHLCELHD